MLTTVFLYRSKFNGIFSVFACPCWTLSRTLDWCYQSLRTIFLYENSEIMRQSVEKIIIIILTVFAWKYQTNIINRRAKQPQARTARTRFSVTCLYLNPKNRARSLSSIRMYAESIVFITVTFSPSVKFTILLAVETRCLTLTASQKMFFSAVTRKVFMLYKLPWFI